MAKNVMLEAQICMDEFYQGFRPANGFFTIEDFAYQIIDERDNLLEAEFLIQYNRNKNSFPVVSPAWLQREVLEIKKDENNRFYADICTPLFEFPQDESGASLQMLSPLGNGCSDFVRIAHNQVWSICMVPATYTNFYSLEKCRVWLHNFYSCTDKLEALIVPSQSGVEIESQTIPDGKAATVREVVINKMFRNMNMKLGKISTHNDGNPNPQPNETSMIYDNLKTK